jgi:hypothetical protein
VVGTIPETNNQRKVAMQTIFTIIIELLDHMLGWFLIVSLGLVITAVLYVFVLLLGLPFISSADHLEPKYHRTKSIRIGIAYYLMVCISGIFLILMFVVGLGVPMFLLYIFAPVLESAHFSTMYESLTAVFISWGANPFIGSLISAISVIAWWIGIASGTISIYEFFKKRKSQNTAGNTRPPIPPRSRLFR